MRTHKERRVEHEPICERYDRACKQRWRALLLCIKAKLEAVDSGIATFEQEFMANIVMPDGKTFGDYALPKIHQATLDNKMPKLLLN